MFAKVKSEGIWGINTFDVTVEADISSGLPRFDIVGLPDAAVKESRDRVRASIKNCGLTFPISRITVNIAPADVKKEGSIYDLPVLIALLKASSQLNGSVEDYAFIGELSLDGELRKINGVLPMVLQAKESGAGAVFIPFENADEGSVVNGIDVLPAKNIIEIMHHISGVKLITPAYKEVRDEDVLLYNIDFSEVKGQSVAKRALEIAAAGGHNCLMIGPPGTGKSMLAKRICTILPEMTFDEQIETTKIYSVAGELPSDARLIARRPFRSPHHTVSAQGLTGGGANPKPGEISLSHNGVLFLDEFPEFDRRAKESLRQPLEDGRVTITRAAGTLTYPSEIMLVAAMNPCPCGYLHHPTRQCSCTEAAKRRYQEKISGPLLDRIDIHVEVPYVDYKQISSKQPEETSQTIRKRVNAARAVQNERFKGTSTKCNAQMTPAMTRKYCIMTDEADEFLKNSYDTIGLSPRAYDKILRISRTIADLEGSETIELLHIAEAVNYRSLDRKYWR